jgi:hypothetical protein
MIVCWVARNGVKVREGSPKGLPGAADRGYPLGSHRMEFPPQPPPNHTSLLNLLNSRRDIASLVHLRDVRVLEVFDVASGYDPGEAEALITTNWVPQGPIGPSI